MKSLRSYEKSISILLIVLASTLVQASETFINASNNVLSRKEAVIALAKGEKVFKLQEMTLGDKGTIHAVKKAKGE